MMKNLAYIASLLLISSVNPEEVKKDLRQINEHYKVTSSITMELTYNYYDSYEATTPEEIKKGVSIKSGEHKQYNKLETIETIQNEDKLLQIDHESGRIVLRKRQKQQIGMEQMMSLMSDAIGDCQSVKYLTSTSTLKELELSHPVSNYKKIILAYHPKLYMLKKIELFLNQQNQTHEAGRLEILIKENTKSTAESNVFLLEKYITKTTDGYELNESYKKQYSFLNMYTN